VLGRTVKGLSQSASGIEPIHGFDWMPKPLHVLLVGDSPADADPIVAELEGGGYTVVSEHVRTAEDLQDALGRGRWDAVISDLDLHRFGSLAALGILRDMGQDLPFIIVSGAVGEEAAVAALKAGAHDFIPRADLARLVPAVERELRDVQTRRERVLALDALRQSEAQHRSLVERSVFGICQVTADGTLLTVNLALVTMLRYDGARDLLEAGLSDVFVDAAARDALVRRVLEHGRFAGEEVMWQPRSGEPIRVRLSGATVDESTPGTPVVEVIVEDVTERHRLQDQLRQAQKMESIGHLAGGIAHDFNNLLTTILGYSELLTEQIGPDVQTGRDLREIMNAAQRASALTRQLLAFSRRQVLTLSAVDLNKVIASLGAMLRRLSGDRITVRTALAGRLRPVKADATQLEQVLINLAVNARDAMPEGGTLTIETHDADLDAAAAAARGAKPGAYALLSVRDTGMGMNREIQDRIFEPFFTTKDLGRGTGLGLAAVHGIVHQLGGHVSVESEPGQGTAFHIYLPETSQAVPAESAHPAVMSAPGNETILLVEDEDAVRGFVKTVLERFGYRVLDAPDAESALALIDTLNSRIDLLLTDVILPKMDGPELARRMTADRPATRVLFMSGYPERMAAADGILEPGLELLEKPFTAQAILTRVRDLLVRELAPSAA
jgi:two-component system, cell cycle sensor histidine kinase and response regulator CckA